jgi:DNA topoisomerase-1
VATSPTTTATENTGAEKQKLFPTDIGMVVNDFLVEHFPTIVDFNFTAKVEEEFDVIAEGKENWREMIARFYKPFHATIGTVVETADRASGSRVLGQDPKTGKDVVARIGRFGPMVQIGSVEDEEKPQVRLHPQGPEHRHASPSRRPWTCSSCPAPWARKGRRK